MRVATPVPISFHTACSSQYIPSCELQRIAEKNNNDDNASQYIPSCELQRYRKGGGGSQYSLAVHTLVRVATTMQENEKRQKIKLAVHTLVRVATYMYFTSSGMIKISQYIPSCELQHKYRIKLCKAVLSQYIPSCELQRNPLRLFIGGGTRSTYPRASCNSNPVLPSPELALAVHTLVRVATAKMHRI